MQRAVQNLIQPNIVYVPMEWSLRFYAVMKPVGPYRNIKHAALFSQANTKLISSCQIISSCQGHSPLQKVLGQI